MLPPGPAAPPLVQVTQYLRNPLAFLEGCRRRFGAVFTLRWPGMGPMVYFTEAGPIREIFRQPPDVLQGGRSNSIIDFVTGPRSVARLDGTAHRQRRRDLASPFRRVGPDWAAAMTGNTIAQIEASAGAPFSFRDLSQSLTLRNLVGCTIGIDDTVRAERLCTLVRTFMRESLNAVVATMWMLVPGVHLRKSMVRWLAPLSGTPLRRAPLVGLAGTIEALDRELYAAVGRARRGGDDDDHRTDLARLLADARPDASDEDLRDELMAILVAGHETTASTLDWCIVELVRRPELMARARAEVDGVVGDGPCDISMLRRLPYLRALIHECLRLHPPVPAVGRYVARPVTIGGVAVPPGVIVSPSIALLHRDPERWPNPRRFDPERFLDTKIDADAFIPFGGGERTCLGRPFAVFQLQVVLATILSGFELRPEAWPESRMAQRGLFVGVGHPVRMTATRRRTRSGSLQDSARVGGEIRRAHSSTSQVS